MQYKSTTNLDYWRLNVDKDGRQTWVYLASEEERANWPQTPYDRYWLGIYNEAPELPSPCTPLDSARNGFEFYRHLQTPSGHWAGEYGGPMFLLPGFVIVNYVTGTPWLKGQREEIIRYIKNRAHPDDGGWGIHIESDSTVFGTALNYVSLRLLGVDAEDPVCIRARATLHRLGGATGIPSWGKFWLSILNVYDWEGNNPIPPELWLLPYWMPVHPGRMWIHTRMVYLPMGYLYGIRFRAKETELIHQLRQELYVTPYEEIYWPAQRNNVCPVDVYCPHTKIFDMLNVLLSIYEKIPNGWLRKLALDQSLKHIRAEDKNTKYCDLAPVNKAMNKLVIWIVDGPDSESFKQHCYRDQDSFWLGAEGIMCNGTNGSQLWDTAFMVQALVESGLAEEKSFKPHMVRALEYIDASQFKEDCEDRWALSYREISKGGWGFSNRDQSYPVSDCCAEAMKSTLLLQNKLTSMPKLISDERLFDTINVLFSMTNPDGGFCSYERRRGSYLLEWLNPAEVFGNIMIEYCYPECTTAVLLGLTTFRKHFPDHQSEEINDLIKRAAQYIKNSQLPDGSWYGSWAICFTYATWFGIESLSSIGESYENSDNVKRACDFLVSKQMKDGGWGEKYKSCELHTYVHHDTSQVVMTSWAVMSLMAAQYPDESVIRAGIKVIMSRQQPNGEWLQEGIEGVFNHNCMISYPNYKFAFTIWALGRYARLYGNPKLA
ncbi:terpenoid cyclases/protein prenyltransferase alpha-alpha toroid [Polychytrium aggregatum]|uniref:terpenoid cyclases/protein prenyltransferase alpha-alpha toroid n=1 Tax=Polychytrium aggregatum TaxID=110093 RepID=UPI0022FE4872|nr:terpenoid cyclases/protein prenyltransferase alpha-alpha toroid [Polychytrium aggregatum]KAI9197493.1 terpenoid cyclases/protein prenyltransferase alpha-alpha toroid [Polychytrium aggregatum]